MNNLITLNNSRSMQYAHKFLLLRATRSTIYRPIGNVKKKKKENHSVSREQTHRVQKTPSLTLHQSKQF